MDSQGDQKVETQVLDPTILSKNLKGVECPVLIKCLSKLYIIGWSCFVNVEDKESLQLNVKVLNELACVIRKALKINEFAV